MTDAHHRFAPREVDELRRRLEEAEDTLRAIRAGAVDAFVVDGSDGPRVYTLETADRPYRTLVESMSQGALVLTTGGVILFANARFSELAGVPGGARLVGSDLAAFVAEADRGRLAGLVAAAREGPRGDEVRFRRPGGAEVPVQLSLSPLLLGNTRLLSAVLSDLSQQKQYEELRRAQQALREADERKDQFIATLAHELRNPLVPLRAGLHVLTATGVDQTQVAETTAMMGRQLTHMVRLIDELLDVSRVTFGTVELRRERTQLADILTTALETGRPRVEEYGHDLEVSFPPEPVEVDADTMRLAQVIVNLLDNAAKFTPKRGTIRVGAGREGGNAVIRVRDHGVGIAADRIPVLFETFTRVTTPPGRAPPGLGIGLSISRRLVELHGGGIEVRSDGEGRGSEFIVRLPVARRSAAHRTDQPAPRHRITPPEAGRVAAARILIADDNVDAAQSLAILLRLSGYEVRTVDGGREALKQAEQFQPHVALLDLAMPDLDGFEVARRIRQAPWGEGMAVVALTGWSHLPHRAEAADAGFDEHLVKPVDPGVLLELLATRIPAAPRVMEDS